MPINTTLHVHKSILETLNKRAEVTGRTRTFIIKLLMQRVMNNSQKMIKSYSRIQYQGRDVKLNWHRLHISVNEYEYEYYLDMRKFYKMSVSFILAYAVRCYLNEITNELLDKNFSTDNYIYKNYTLMKYTIDEIICWQIYWGIHPQIFDTPSPVPY
jgi:hypothetical protein